MGTYSYLLRSPKLARKVKVLRPDGSGEEVTVASIGFAYKISWSRPEPKWVAPFMARMQAAWDSKRPSFAALTSHLDDQLNDLPPSKRFRVEVDQPVYHWPGRPIPFAMSDASAGLGDGVYYGRIVAVL